MSASELRPETNPHVPPTAAEDGDRREIGNLAVWSLSTCKPNFGIEQIRDDNLETYWQSDGPQPHLISIQFPKKMTVTEVKMYLDYKQDESYTPQRLSVRAGTCYQDLQYRASSSKNRADGYDSPSGKLMTGPCGRTWCKLQSWPTIRTARTRTYVRLRSSPPHRPLPPTNTRHSRRLTLRCTDN
ncbi:anaphase-promoting complex, subunit 10-domain-containing protein [Hyaloraphidium curvatum]|nr:anaphase-promoting complex, subunit 10-domain-containing protein [Hyaloraphidium curvatum]